MRTTTIVVALAWGVTACGTDVVTETAASGAGATSTHGGHGGAGGGAGAAGGCGGDCISCCNFAHCPPEVPVLGSDCVIQPGVGNKGCDYVESDSCIYSYFCDPPGGTWTKLVEPVDCPGACIESPGFLCLEPGKVCYFDYDPGGCNKQTCSAEHRLESELDLDNPCP